MSDVFISYSRQDRPRAEALVEILQADGVTIWWDRELIAGELYNKVIEEQLHSAKCVIVLWSEHSVDSNWVFAEANEGANRKVLVPVLLDEVTVPLAFRALQAVSLVKGLDDAEGLRMLTSAVRRLVGERSTGVDPMDVLVRVACPACGAPNTAPAHLAGRRGKCRQCGEAITIPGEAGGPQVLPAAAAPSARTGRRKQPGRLPAGGRRSGSNGLVVGAVAVLLAAVVGLVLWSGEDDPGLNTKGDQSTDSGTAQARADERRPAQPVDPALKAAHDQYDRLGGAQKGDVAALLAICRGVIDQVDSSDPRTAAVLATLASRTSAGSDVGQQVADLQRWLGRPQGQRQDFEQALAAFEQQLDRGRLDEAQTHLDRCAKLLSSARELSGARQRLDDTREQRAAATELEQTCRALLAQLDEAGGHLPSLAVAMDEAGRFVADQPEVAGALGLRAATSSAQAAWDERRLSLDRQLGDLDRDVGRARDIDEVAQALTLLDVCLDELPGTDSDALLEGAVETWKRALQQRLDDGDDHRAGLSLLVALAPVSAALVSQRGVDLARTGEQAGLAQVSEALKTLGDDDARARAVAALAVAATAAATGDARSTGQAPSTRLESLAGNLLTGLAGAQPDTAAAGREQLARLDTLFPSPLPGVTGERLEAIRAGLQQLIAAEGAQLQAAFRDARKLLDAGDLAGAASAYSDIVRDAERGSAAEAAARFGQAEVARARLPKNPDLTDTRAIEDVMGDYAAVRTQARPENLKDFEGRSLSAFSCYRIIEMYERIKRLNTPMTDKIRQKANGEARKDQQAELAKLKRWHPIETDTDGKLFSTKANDVAKVRDLNTIP